MVWAAGALLDLEKQSVTKTRREDMCRKQQEAARLSGGERENLSVIKPGDSPPSSPHPQEQLAGR